MKKKIILAVMVTSAALYVLSSCYQNREDILQVPVEKVSFKRDVVPIVTSGGCGCHNLNGGAYAKFSSSTGVNYDVILARVNAFKTWVNGGSHPGMGGVDFTLNQRFIIKKWIDQGPPYDADDTGNDCATGGETYTGTISAIYTTTCKGGSCHANGTVPDLTYNLMVTKKSTLQTMMDNSGTSGHPGGVLSLTSCTVSKFKSWLSLNQPY